MGTFWLKVAAIVIVIIAGVIIILKFLPSESEKAPQPQKTFYDVTKEDDERLRAVPKISQPQPPELQTEQKTEEKIPQFKELTPEQEAHAQQLFEWALAQRKMGRLPGMTYKKMVDTCREIIELYPDSEYAYKAKRMLGDIPEQYRKQYNITDSEMVIEQ